jgi:4-amino-4-deoxy-L-arabinose transferase-like glycosyltransferase
MQQGLVPSAPEGYRWAITNTQHPVEIEAQHAWKTYFFLGLFCLALYLPGLVNLPPTDRDEARFAQASKQMLESGNFVDIRFQDKPRYKKPIGIYWLQAAVAGLTVGPGSNAIWAYRLPSVAGAMIAVLLTLGLGRFLVGFRAAFWGALLLGACLLLAAEAHLAKTDALLLASVTAMQGALGRAYLGWRRHEPVSWGTTLLFWAAGGVGVLLKGPVPPVIALLTIITLSVADRRRGLWGALRPGVGLVVMLAIVLPWFVAITRTSQGEFLRQAIGTDLLPKLISGQESHGAWPGYYALLFTALFWPGSLLALAAFWPSWQKRDEPAMRFLLAWLIPAWLLFEVVPTKLPNYILPTFPAMALLTGRFLETIRDESSYLQQPLFRCLRWPVIGLWGLVTVLLGVGLVGLPAVANHTLSVPGLVALAGAVTLLILVCRFGRQCQGARLVGACAAAGLLVLIPALGAVLPGLKGLWLSNSVVEAMHRHGAGPGSVLATVDYKEPSLVFLAGTDTLLTNAVGAAQFLKRHPEGWVLIGARQAQAFLAAAKAGGVVPEGVECLTGFNYTKGKRMQLILYRRGASPPSVGPP